MDSDPVSQKHKRSHVDHLECSLLQLFMRDSQMLKCFCSTTPLAWELVRRNIDVIDAIFLGQITSHCHECRTIVSNISATPPHLQRMSSNIKLPRVFSFSFRRGHHSGQRRHGTMSLDEIVKLVYGWHEHGVDVNLPKEGGDVGIVGGR